MVCKLKESQITSGSLTKLLEHNVFKFRTDGRSSSQRETVVQYEDKCWKKGTWCAHCGLFKLAMWLNLKQLVFHQVLGG